MEQKSLKKNAIWNFIYTGTNLISPLITAPYVSRVLGASNLGQVEFARSFTQWFIIFAAFGITTYGVRAISQVRDNKKLLSKTFSELFVVNLLFSIVSTIIYLIVIFDNNNLANELPLFIVMSFSIVLNAVNIDWFYQAIEQYDYITKRNFVIKLTSFVFIFLFVKNPSDYVLYGFISVIGIGLSGILNVFHSRKYTKFTYKNIDMKPHMKPLGTFFLMTFIINIYTNLDSTFLGFVSTTSSVAFLSRAKSVINIGRTVTNSITNVAMPRASYYLKANYEKYKELISKVPDYIMILTIPMVSGIIVLAPEIMHILGGKEFIQASFVLAIIASSMIFSSLSTFLQQQVLIPNDKEFFGLIAAIISAVVSIVFNIILIPRFDYVGAGIALVLAEFSAMLSRYIYTRKIGYDFIKFLNASTVKYIIASLIMIIPVYVVKHFLSGLLVTFLLSASLGAGAYFLTLILLKEKLILLYLNKLLKLNNQ